MDAEQPLTPPLQHSTYAFVLCALFSKRIHFFFKRGSFWRENPAEVLQLHGFGVKNRKQERIIFANRATA